MSPLVALFLELVSGVQVSAIDAAIAQRLDDSTTALKASLQAGFESRDHSALLGQLQGCDLALLGVTFVAESAGGQWADPCALAGFDYSDQHRQAAFAEGAVPTSAALRALGQSGRAMRVADGEHLRFRALSMSREASAGEVPVTISWRCAVNRARAAAVAEWAEPWTSAMQVSFPLDPATVAVWWSPAGCTVASGGDSVHEWWDSAPPALAATVDLYDLLSSMRSWHWCSAEAVAPPRVPEAPVEPPGSWQHEVRWEVVSGGRPNRTVTHRLDGAGALRSITILQKEFSVLRRPLEKCSFSRSGVGTAPSRQQPDPSVSEDWHPETNLTRWPGGARIHIVLRDVLPTVDVGLPTSIDGVAQVVPDRIEIASDGLLFHEIRFSAFERVAGVVPEWPNGPPPGPRAPWDALSTVPASIEAALQLTRRRCETLELRALVPIAVASTILATESATPRDLDEAERLLHWALSGQSAHELTTAAVDLVRLGEVELASTTLDQLIAMPHLPLGTLRWLQGVRALGWNATTWPRAESAGPAFLLDRFLEGSPIRIEHGRTLVPSWFAPKETEPQPSEAWPPLA